MKEPAWRNDDQLRTWTNGLWIGIGTAWLLILPVGSLLIFFNEPVYVHALWVGITLLGFMYELVVNAFIRITYLNGVLEFERPLRKYSLLFRKRKRKLTIRPDEWTELYWYSRKNSFTYYFRKGQTAAYFVSGDGFTLLRRKLEKLFPGRLKTSLDFPKATRKRLKKEFPERVF